MKTSIMSLALGLVLLLALTSDALPQAPNSPEQCCFSFSEMKIPKDKIAKVEKTSSDCPQEGFVVTTVAGRVLCKKEVSINVE